MESQDQFVPTPVLLGRHHQSAPRTEDRRGSDGRNTPPLGVPSGGGVATLGGESHLITIAPAAAGRTRACVTPNLLTYPGQVVVVDLTGEAYTTTSRVRREMGHRVVRLDPFRVIDQESDALNPLDLLQGLDAPALESACQDIAALVSGFHSFTDVWENAAFGLVSGVVGYLSAVPEKNKFADLYSTFHSDDVVYNLAVVLDTIGKRIPKMAYMEISAFLQKAEAERSRVLTSVTSQLKALSTQETQKALSTSSFPLADFIEGKPVSIYMIVPPAKLLSHSSLLRIWVGTLLHAVFRRRVCPAQPTLFLLDECAKLGPFPQLEAAIHSRAGCGLRVWTFWNDLEQLRGLYPASWLFSGCGAVQVFGVRDYTATAELAALLGIEPEDIRSLAADEQIVRHDDVAQRIRQLDFLTDPLFAGRFDHRR